jgi:hypothetical protein
MVRRDGMMIHLWSTASPSWRRGFFEPVLATRIYLRETGMVVLAVVVALLPLLLFALAIALGVYDLIWGWVARTWLGAR